MDRRRGDKINGAIRIADLIQSLDFVMDLAK
jgi:hypothetical protein